MKKYYFLLVLIFSFTLIRVKAQVPPGHYIVTSDATGTGTGTFETAFAAAVQYANVGNHAYIEMNAPGLCKVDAPFPVCTLATNAKITIRKADLQICPILQCPIQGFTLISTYDFSFNYNNSNYGVSSCNPSVNIPISQDVFSFTTSAMAQNTKISFEGLSFINFSFYAFLGNINSSAVVDGTNVFNFNNLHKVDVINCEFTFCENVILASNNSEILVIDNLFQNTLGIHFYGQTTSLQKTSFNTIINNTFLESQNYTYALQNNFSLRIQPSPDECTYIGTLNVNGVSMTVTPATIGVENKFNLAFEQKYAIIDNHIEGSVNGVLFNSQIDADLKLKLELEYNEIEGSEINLFMNNPMKHFKLNNNTFNINSLGNRGINILANCDHANWPSANCGIDFIEHNFHGYVENNKNNTFINNHPFGTSFSLAGDFETNFNIIGLNLPKNIVSKNLNGLFYRANKVIASEVVDYPFQTFATEVNNLDIIGDPPFTLSSINITNSNYINVTFSQTNNSANLSNKSIWIDLYTSNSNGDLLDFIGMFEVNSNNGISPDIPIPGNLNLSNYTRYAYISNTYDQSAFNSFDLNHSAHSGSSKSSYIEESNITHCCPNLQASITINGTTYNYDPNIVPNPNPNPITACAGEFMLNVNNCGSPNMQPYVWNIVAKDKNGGVITNLGLTSNNSNQTYSAISNGNVETVTISLTAPAPCTFSWTLTFKVDEPCALPCIDCISSFAPISGETYVLSAWVKEQVDIENTIDLVNYTNAKILIEFEFQANTPPSTPLPPFLASGQIIETWQRIEKEFTIPANATDIKISLMTTTGVVSYFDDIRVFPAKGNMKSFVYDPESKRLMAELDERNYATFYEYNEEGKLTRIKKETEKGVYTIKESRSSLMKK
jgi:hypothetical protein